MRDDLIRSLSKSRTIFDRMKLKYTREAINWSSASKECNFRSARLLSCRITIKLLSKVQRAIGNFEGSSVAIEGHTDSTGSKEINDALSQQRADAVKDYLVANKTLPANKIVARGYGSVKPVASNATAEGRAANRRIDVIVTPRLQPGQ